MATNAFGPPTIGRASFAAVLSRANSPVLAERAADEYYDCILSFGLDPAFMLAVFCHESNYATAKGSVVLNYGTKNWGNTRSLSLPGGVAVYADVPGKGRYVKFSTWLVGLQDACNRLLSPAYPYAKANARTVEAIIPIWAPASDNNSPSGYVAAVLALMAGWKEVVTMAVAQYADVLQIIPAGANRPGNRITRLHAVVAHETDNEASGANAAMHYGYITGAPRSSKPSFHFCADSGVSRQFLPAGPADAEIGWHIGDGADEPLIDEAFYTVGGEICVNSRAGFPAACRNMARSFARVLFAWGLPVVDGVTLRQHGSYRDARNPSVHGGCPKHLKAGDWGVTWAQFVAMVKAEYAALQPVAKAPVSDEAAALKTFGDAIPFAYRGELLREGDADLTRFGGKAAEWVCFYERMITHRLNGQNFVMTLPLALALRFEGKLRAYPDFPY